MKSLNVLQTILVILLALALMAGLAAYTWAGTNARLWADDFCYSAAVQEHGLLDGTRYWYEVGGNRFSALWGVALTDLFGPGITAWLPGLVIGLWVLAWGFAINSLAHRLGWRWRKALPWLASLALVYFNLLMAPHLLQSLYWRMGMLHYSLPLVIFGLNVGLLVRAWPRGRGSARKPWLPALGCGLLAFVAAGLSETYAAYQTGALLAALVLGIWLSPPGKRLQVAALLGLPLATSLLAMVIMASAPANAWRQALLPPPAGIAELVVYTLRYSLDFVVDSLRTLPLPTLVFTALLFTFGLLAGEQPEFERRRVLAGIVLALLLGFGLVICAIAPSAYAGLQYPAGRALTVARFAFLLGLAVASWSGGRLVRSLLPARSFLFIAIAALLVMLAASAYTFRSLGYPLAEGRELQVKADRWDARHAQIIASRQAGIRELTVLETDVVATLEDIGPDPHHWVNGCVADYYRLDSITALP